MGATQLVIVTSRQGPPDMARISIQLVDIASGEELPATNLSGILLMLTRGRYTVNWLQPNRWYGVHFRAEQHYAGGAAVYANEESHLVKTRRADASSSASSGEEGNKPVLTVHVQRYGDRGRSLENLVLTVRWEIHPDERPNLDALTNITLFCAEQIKYKQLRLRSNEVDKSVEIQLENHFEVHEQRNGSARRMVATIKPKNCPRICWNTEMVVETRRWQFRRAAAHNCEEIAPISAATNLRDFVGYELTPGNNNLVIHTRYPMNEHANDDDNNNNENSNANSTADGVFSDANTQQQSSDANSYVQVMAIIVPEPRKADNATIRYKTFHTNKDGGEEEFVVDGLEPGKLYAVQYTYGRQSPFAYEESRRFLVDTGAGVEPMRVEFNLSGEHGMHPSVVAIALLDPAFKQYELGIDVEPLCEPSEPPLHFWLDADRQPSREFRELRILDALCTAAPGHSICQAASIAPTIRGCGMRDGQLCWTTNIVAHEKLFSAERKCIELAHAVPQLPSTTTLTTTTANSSVKREAVGPTTNSTTRRIEQAARNAATAVAAALVFLPLNSMQIFPISAIFGVALAAGATTTFFIATAQIGISIV